MVVRVCRLTKTCYFFFFNDTATTEIYTLSLHDALPISVWQSLTTLREHRGDGHNAALLQRGISGVGAHVLAAAAGRDRKSTRLNSSHANISYAVFCLKKKKLKKAVSSTPIRCLTYVCTA